MKLNVVFLLLLINATTSSIIHIIGDSHSFSYQINGRTDLADLSLPPIAIHWLGPITMHRVGRDGIAFLDIRQYNVVEGDTVLFVFGEIDARCHIGKIKDRDNRTLDDVLDELVSHYINTLKTNKNFYQNIMVIVSGIVPPIDSVFNPQFPYYGTIEERVSITKQLNNKLKEQCAYCGFGFIDTYTEFADANGQLILALSENVHIEKLHNRPLLEQLAKIISLS
ncbi:hypothetical protein Noda2021_11250 [Candidatus Dependentiae bacterium Noda2021]|nr:hypothetical protein Noda2021_11250 [Candidatus Dependentiae bacterium Noda2021]